MIHLSMMMLYNFRPSKTFSMATFRTVPLCILIFSTAVNANRFLEYEAEVNFQIVCSNICMSFFQTVVSLTPTWLKIEGAILLGYDNATEKNRWQWSHTHTTALRSDSLYYKVCEKYLFDEYQFSPFIGLYINFNFAQLDSFRNAYIIQPAHIPPNQEQDSSFPQIKHKRKTRFTSRDNPDPDHHGLCWLPWNHYLYQCCGALGYY